MVSQPSPAVLSVRFGLRQTDDLRALFPLAAFLEQLYTLEAFQDVSFGRDGAGPFETAMLRHTYSWESERPQ